jgi:ABC-type transport system involved in cytochrome bd biosynthesis fused ATPase/permease subunit
VTHDARGLEFADRTIRIEDGLIVQNPTEAEFPAGMLAYLAQPSQVATA